MLQCSEEELDLFWHLTNSDVDVLEKQLCQQVPNIVQKSFDSIKVFVDTQETIQVLFNIQAQLEEIDLSETDA